MFPEDEYQLETASNPQLRDVTSTARLFNFRRPVFLTTDVWQDCVELKSSKGGKAFDELAVLQRLRHVLFMAAGLLHGRNEDLEFNFRIYRVPNLSKGSPKAVPEPVDLHLVAQKDASNSPVIVIDFPAESA